MDKNHFVSVAGLVTNERNEATNILSHNSNMFCYAFPKDPFSFVETDEFKVGL